MAYSDKRIEEIKEMIYAGKYFTINRARQYGKTTTLYLLKKKLQKEYIVLKLSFEGADSYFTSEEAFVNGFWEDVEEELHRQNLEVSIWGSGTEPKKNYVTMKELGRRITKLCEQMNKEIILFIDEVDKSADNQIFLSFLGMLREKFIRREMGEDITFHSVVLAGVYDIKNLKLKLRNGEEQKYNSPWNISSDFNIDMALSAEEITGMLKEYEQEHQYHIDINWFANKIWEYTQGYPYLVSRICKLLDEEIWKTHENAKEKEAREQAWTGKGFQKVIKSIVTSRSTLFDDINKNIEAFPELGKMLKFILLYGQHFSYTLSDDIIQLGTMFGYLREKDGEVAIHNRIFEMYLYDMFYKKSELENQLVKKSSYEKNQFIQNGQLDMNQILERFAIHYHGMFEKQHQKFFEDECRFLFITFIKPIINGIGNYYIEARTRDQRRMDIVIDYLGQQYIIELKIWYGEKYIQDGREQLADYLDSMESTKGWLVSFYFGKKKLDAANYEIQEKEIYDKKILEIVV